MWQVLGVMGLSMFLIFAQIMPGQKSSTKQQRESSPSQEQTTLPTAVQSSLVIFTGLWKVNVRKDGSGYLLFGRSGGAVAVFRPQTFNVKKITTDLRARMSPKQPRYEAGQPMLFSAWIATDDDAGEILWEESPGPIADVFRLIRREYEDGTCVQHSSQFEKLWRTHPPATPHPHGKMQPRENPLAQLTPEVPPLKYDAEKAGNSAASKPTPLSTASVQKGIVTDTASLDTNDRFCGGYLWLLEYKRPVGIELQNLLEQLKASKIPNKEEAESKSQCVTNSDMLASRPSRAHMSSRW